ncbi:MAG: hypothetical protein ACJARE_000143 [Paracoccaceae bacterium]|jgi:hypothetical protein
MSRVSYAMDSNRIARIGLCNNLILDNIQKYLPSVLENFHCGALFE